MFGIHIISHISGESQSDKSWAASVCLDKMEETAKSFVRTLIVLCSLSTVWGIWVVPGQCPTDRPIQKNFNITKVWRIFNVVQNLLFKLSFRHFPCLFQVCRTMVWISQARWQLCFLGGLQYSFVHCSLQWFHRNSNIQAVPREFGLWSGWDICGIYWARTISPRGKVEHFVQME